MPFLIFYVFYAIALIFIISGFMGAPYVPSKIHRVEEMLRLAGVREGEKAADLGSGDGRVVIALAQRGAEAHGYEVNPLLVLWSFYRVYRAGMWGRAHIHWWSYWKADLGKYDVVIMYGIGGIMNRLKEKLFRELNPQARIVCQTFRIPGFRPLRNNQDIYLYVPEVSAPDRHRVAL